MAIDWHKYPILGCCEGRSQLLSFRFGAWESYWICHQWAAYARGLATQGLGAYGLVPTGAYEADHIGGSLRIGDHQKYVLGTGKFDNHWHLRPSGIQFPKPSRCGWRVDIKQPRYTLQWCSKQGSLKRNHRALSPFHLHQRDQDGLGEILSSPLWRFQPYSTPYGKLYPT